MSKRAEVYDLAHKQVESLIKPSEKDKDKVDPSAAFLMGLSNASSVLFYALNELADVEAKLQHLPVNWLGFYLMSSPTQLTLGPFQGKVACTRIPLGKGVCGTAALTRQTQVVPDVHALPNHIACDSSSNSEIVVPIRANGATGEIVGVLDIDSTIVGFFSDEDAAPLKAFCEMLSTHLQFPAIGGKLGTADKPKDVSGAGTGGIAAMQIPAPGGAPRPNPMKAVQQKTAKKVGGCTFEVGSLPQMAADTFLTNLSSQLNVAALPEIVFAGNQFSCAAKDAVLLVDAEAYLAAAAAFYGTAKFETDKNDVSIEAASSWKQRQKEHNVFDPRIDWAFRGHFLGSWRSTAGGNAAPLIPVPTDKRINFDELKRTDLPIVLFDAKDLFEDDLHDHGLSKLTIKFRVMETCFFVLVRNFVRIDGKIAISHETRIFHMFGETHAVIQYTKKAKALEVAKDGRQAAPSDSEEFVATMETKEEEHFEVPFSSE